MNLIYIIVYEDGLCRLLFIIHENC